MPIPYGPPFYFNKLLTSVFLSCCIMYLIHYHNHTFLSRGFFNIFSNHSDKDLLTKSNPKQAFILLYLHHTMMWVKKDTTSLTWYLFTTRLFNYFTQIQTSNAIDTRAVILINLIKLRSQISL